MSFKRKVTAAAALTLAAAMTLTGCSSSGDDTAMDDGSLLTIDVYDDFANYQGVQSGWFGELVKEKFNIELNIIAPNVGGTELFDTRSAAGDLGDLVLVNASNHSVADLITAGLIEEMTPYLDGMDSIEKWTSAIESLNEQIGQEDGVWGIPSSVSSSAPTDPSEGNEPTYGPYIRWDYYAEIGYPEIPDLDALLDVLEQMQSAARADTGNNDIYALSLFKDWDDNMMNNAKQPTCFYGYDELGFVLAKADGSDFQSVTQEDGIYERVLRFFNEAYQRGLVDPESSTQDYDTMYAKYQEGEVLFSFWPWLGQAAYNTDEHKEAGEGFMIAPLEDMQIFSYGASPNGSNYVMALGSNADSPERVVEFIDWLYSSEGIYASSAQTSGSAGPEGMTWEMVDGEPVLTDLGDQAFYGSDATVPDEYGGGTYADGISALNFVTEVVTDIDEETGYTYSAELWPSTIENHQNTALDQDWSEHMGGYSTTMEYLEANDMLLVAPGAGYIVPDDDSVTATIRGQIKTEIQNSSWQAVFASSDDEFESILDQMRATVDGLGMEDVLEVDMQNAADQQTAREAIVEEWNAENSEE